MFHNRAPIVCLILLALTTSAFIATRSTTGQAPQANNRPLKMKVLRDKTRVKTSPGPWEIAAFRKSLPQENERQLEDLIPKHVPIKIKIKKEKEAGFKDLNNEKWAWEFELEVTNTGTKPIYSLDLYVVTDVKAAAGFRIVSMLSYGRPELGDIRTKAEPTDVPIQPGESVFMPRKVVHRWGCLSGKPGKIINVYQPAGKMEEFFREIGKPFKDLITLEQLVNKTYTKEQVKSLHQLFDAHGMDLLGPPLGME